MGRGAGGGSGTLGSSRLGARSPMLWPKYVHDIEGYVLIPGTRRAQVWAITPGETGATSNSYHQREEAL